MGRCALHLFLWELELRCMGCTDWNSAIRTYSRTSFRRSRGQKINGRVMDLVLTTVIYLTFIYYIIYPYVFHVLYIFFYMVYKLFSN